MVKFMKEMSFIDMGELERCASMQKSIIIGDVKGVTIRLEDGFLEILNQVSDKVDLSRQAFMSKVVKYYSAVAVADYLVARYGYDTSCSELFGDNLKDDLKNFLDDVDWFIDLWRVERKAVQSLPKDNEIYKEFHNLYFKKHLKENPEFKQVLVDGGLDVAD